MVKTFQKPRYIKGQLAVCPNCTRKSANVSYCAYCKYDFPDNVIMVNTLTVWENNIAIQVSTVS